MINSVLITLIHYCCCIPWSSLLHHYLTIMYRFCALETPVITQQNQLTFKRNVKTWLSWNPHRLGTDQSLGKQHSNLDTDQTWVQLSLSLVQLSVCSPLCVSLCVLAEDKSPASFSSSLSFFCLFSRIDRKPEIWSFTCYCCCCCHSAQVHTHTFNSLIWRYDNTHIYFNW